MSVYIKEIRNQDKSIKLINDFIDESKIVITIIIGKNGSGKSNLLKKICYFQILSYLDENQISIHSYRNDKNLLSQIDINTSISFLMDKKEKIYNVTNLFNINSDDDDNSKLMLLKK
jgi:ABC-type cobalamin/Fe3+-siderophores transport system ATPase subunit